jgi:glycosyltransferase involved in cell wall biosynthesis
VKRRNLLVRLLGWQKDITHVISASDLWVLTSDNEATPLSILEAAFGAVPSVACNVGDVSHAIVDGKTGLVVDADPEALAGGIVMLGKNTELLNQMGTEAKLRANSLFAAQIMIERHLALYQKLAS